MPFGLFQSYNNSSENVGLSEIEMAVVIGRTLCTIGLVGRAPDLQVCRVVGVSCS